MESLRPLEYGLLADRVYAVLRDKLLRREFGPGERLSSRELAAGLGVSVAPVKAATARLAGEGLVTVHARRGTFVTPLSTRDVEDLFDTRLALELLAVEQACHRATAHDLAELRQVLAAHAALSRQTGHPPDRVAEIIAADYAFHLRLVAASHNRHLLAAYEGVKLKCQMVAYSRLAGDAYYSDAVPSHGAILDAVQAGAVAAARDHLRAHVLRSKHQKVVGLGGAADHPGSPSSRARNGRRGRAKALGQ